MRVPSQPYEAGASTGLQRKPGDVGDGPDTADARRLIVERLQPEIDGGRFPIKRTVGESVSVTVDLFADGHDLIAGVLKYRHVPTDPWAGSGSAKEAADPALWTEVPLTELGDDRWGASFAVTEPGEYEYTVEGWIDRFATWSAGLIAKADAGQDVTSELLEGAPLAEDDRRRSTTYDRILRVIVDPVRARFGAWYEMFPRSCTQDPTRSGTFRDAEARLPDIAAMGFDVVYLPPVHPIGRTHRKGPNNSLNSRPGDPGSPWAIGSDEGGHTAIEPGLGTLDDVAPRTRHRPGHRVSDITGPSMGS
jgi:starch synthase (maltosyl-transferring)